jgi:hypothetical protein
MDAGKKMNLDQSKDKQQASRYILGYLLDHPEAGDTLEGIVEWWLLHQRIRFETRNVSQAVAELVAQGLIVKQKGPDSRIIYKANRSSENIQTMLGAIKSLSDEDDS